MKKLIIIILSLFLISCSNKKNEQNMFGLFKSKKELTRKEKTEKFLKKKGIKINYNLPHIEAESETTLRTAKEIAERVTVLSVTNLVAFNGMTGEQAIEYLKKYDLWKFVTPNEKEFLKNPTDEKRTKKLGKQKGFGY